MTDTAQFCTFFVADRFFGVDVTRVQEVIRYQEMTRVPLASPVIRGLINLRGQIVTALDMRARLGLASLSAGRLPMNVVVRTDDGAVSLLVDEIGDVVEVADDCREDPPETMSAEARELISGIYKLKGQLLLVLDPERAIAEAAVRRGTEN
ncbi:MAG TPA: chemotaxis protein CheW [Polyangiaceae bacterium]|jgi:purine-binding chemotaxis protein CheW|nr:chemotaxis protein CheW [Polyangiaceae bacterium]